MQLGEAGRFTCPHAPRMLSTKRTGGSQVTSLPGDVVNVLKLCKTMIPKITKIDYCVEEEITGLDRFESVYNCELRCCIGKGTLRQISYISDSIQGLRCGKENKFCINGVCYNRQDWIEEYLPKGSVDIRPDVPPKKWV
uniref:Putative metalloprotease n=1 Tax=Ixodes ricinus TaxID=34613 RepID=A0A0K8RA78_IXORI